MGSLGKYEEIGSLKRKERDEKIPAEWRVSVPEDTDSLLELPRSLGIFSKRELNITESYDSVGLIEQIRKGEFTSLEVAQAFCKRAAVAQQALNCLTEIFFDKAYERARFLDEHFQRTGTVLGPLHGLPIALKDSINVAGVDSTIGMTGYAFQPEKENSVVVDILLSLGAVVYVKTNVPQSMMVPDTENFVFGRCRNPHSKYLTAAGSSGGLGALVGFRGALMGIGTDVGGSVRVPAYCNGVYGVKPSSGRLPYHLVKGYLTPGAESVGILCVNGVIAVSMRDCDLLLRSVAEAEPWLSDPGCSYLPWEKREVPSHPLAFGVIREDHESTMLPPVRRALEETCEKLRAAGHEIIELGEFYRSAELTQNAQNLFKIEGGKGLDSARALTGEPYTNAVLNGNLYPCEEGDLQSLFAHTLTRTNLQHDWLKLWKSTATKTKSGRPIDAVICPPQGGVPRPHERLIRSHFSRNWNVLDYPAAIVQVGKVDLSKDGGALPPPKSPADAVVQSIFTGDLQNRYEGFPMAIQLVGQYQQEPKLMQLALMVDELMAAYR